VAELLTAFAPSQSLKDSEKTGFDSRSDLAEMGRSDAAPLHALRCSIAVWFNTVGGLKPAPTLA
jgi:hypothetical protein